MIETVQFLLPAFLVCVCLVGIHTYFGIQVLARKVIFVDLALAQMAALGATLAFMLGHGAQSAATYGYSLSFTVLAAVVLAYSRSWSTRVPQEALIGVVYVVSAAAAVLLVDRAPQGAEHLKQILTGNIIASGLDDIKVIVPVYLAIGGLHALLGRRMSNPDSILWEFVFYATFGVVVTSSVAIGGVLLVFSFLIVPAAIGLIFSSTLAGQLAIGWGIGALVSAAGLAASFAWDLPTGAALVCAFGIALICAGLVRLVLDGRGAGANGRSALRIARWALALVAGVGAAQVAIAPRSEQPVLDAAERIAPWVRGLYMTRVEQATLADAASAAERYRLEAERLNQIEKRSRTEGDKIDDAQTARISSFLKTYGEMRKGEQFVMGEVKARARERNRWWLGSGLLVLALALAPLSWRIVLRRAPPGAGAAA